MDIPILGQVVATAFLMTRTDANGGTEAAEELAKQLDGLPLGAVTDTKPLGQLVV
jgi:hypothetical protein